MIAGMIVAEEEEQCATVEEMEDHVVEETVVRADHHHTDVRAMAEVLETVAKVAVTRVLLLTKMVNTSTLFICAVCPIAPVKTKFTISSNLPSYSPFAF